MSNFVLECRRYEVESYEMILEMELERISTQQISKIINEVIKICLTPLENQSTNSDQVTLQSKVSLSFNTEYLKSLDQFILSSSLGDFLTRLELLERMLILAPDNFVLESFICYYKLVKEYIVKNRTDILSLISKEYDEFVKVVKWKNINVLHLKQATEKSHKTIAKLVRKLRTELAQPTVIVLKNFDICRYEVEKCENESSITTLPSSIDSSKFKRCTEISDKVCQHYIIDEYVAELFDGIAERVNDLSAITNALSQKTKAFDDLLKYLKTKGLKSKSFVIESFDVTSILPLQHLPNGKYPKYYYRSVFMLGKLLNAFHSHSSFIVHAKASKFVGYILDLFLIAKKHFQFAHQLIFSTSNRSYATCIENLDEIKTFAGNFKVVLLKIEFLINKFKFNISLDLLKPLHDSIQFIFSVDKFVDNNLLNQLQSSLESLLAFNLNINPVWLFFELKTLITENSHLTPKISDTKLTDSIAEEKELIFFQNLNSLNIIGLVDSENGDLIDGCFSSISSNDELIRNLLSYCAKEEFNYGSCYYSSNVVSYVVDRCIVITLSLVKGNLQDDAG